MNKQQWKLAMVVIFSFGLFMAASTAINLASQVSGVLPAANGGTGLNAVTNNAVVLGSSGAWTAAAVPTCADSSGNHLNYSAGAFSCGTSSAASINFAENELPTGTINGANTTFTLAHPPSGGSLKLYKNGVHMQSGAGNDFTLASATVTMLAAPATGDILLADYRW